MSYLKVATWATQKTLFEIIVTNFAITATYFVDPLFWCLLMNEALIITNYHYRLHIRTLVSLQISLSALCIFLAKELATTFGWLIKSIIPS